MASQEFFVHGVSACAGNVGDAYLKNFEFDDEEGHHVVDWSNVVGLPTERERVFVGRGGTFNAFHVAVPTPVMINDARPRCEWVSFVCDPQADAAFVYGIRAFQGTQLYREWTHIRITGDQSRQWRENFTFFRVASPGPMLGPLNVVAWCNFVRDAQIRVIAAGARFLF
jgi:hypothetical protein